MTQRISGLIARCWLGLALVILLGACSKPDSRRILGHWRAEQVQLQGFRLPMGPEFVVSQSELRSPDGEVNIPLSSISEEGETITLNVPLGLGLTFRFESNERISFEIPLVDTKIYYRRVSAAMPGASPAGDVTAPALPAESQTENQSAHKTATAPPKVESWGGSDAMVDYNQSVMLMRQGDTDAAVRSLHNAFEHGFRDFQLLEASQDITPLRSDPRYQALVTHYR